MRFNLKNPNRSRHRKIAGLKIPAFTLLRIVDLFGNYAWSS